MNRMLVDTGTAVNLMSYSVQRRLGRSTADLIKTNIMLNDFNGQPSEAQGVLNVELTVGCKTVPTSFFIINKQEYVHSAAWEGLDSRQLLCPFQDASVFGLVGWQ